MIKITYSIFARPELSDEEVRTLWMEEHGALLQRHAKTLGIARYVQTLRVQHPIEGKMRRSRGTEMDGPFGMAELYWESMETLEDSFTRPAAVAAYRELLEDEKRFAARSVAAPWIGVERQVI
ncbi:EthD domain-containing protein [Mesorhizobium sp. CCNWLW179-1]|uniref:EthD domain-containing protein n=1 Tax=unclassified Mesorhizobium TaxID=325217 RepID=UPI00301574B8